MVFFPLRMRSSIASLSFESDHELKGYPSTLGGIWASSAIDALSSSVNFGFAFPGFFGLMPFNPPELKVRMSSLMWYSLRRVILATSWTVIP